MLPSRSLVDQGRHLGLEPSELRQIAGSDIDIEPFIKIVNEATVLGLVGVLEKVVEVTLLGVESPVEVGEDTSGGSGHGEGSVWVGGSRDAAMPVIENCKLRGEHVYNRSA